SWAVLIGVVLGSAATVAYSARFIWGAFGNKRDSNGELLALTTIHAKPDAVFLAAPAALSVLTLVFAAAPGLVQHLVEPFSALFEPPAPGVEPTYLALWHGLTPVLGLSVLTWVLGLGLFWLLGTRDEPPRAVPVMFDAERIYRSSIRALDDFSAWLTSNPQRGSLGWYLFIIVTVATAAPA